MPALQLSHICFLGLCSAVFYTYPGGRELVEAGGGDGGVAESREGAVEMKREEG